MIEQNQSELLPATIRERIEAAAKRFHEREERKARRRLAKMRRGSITHIPSSNLPEVSQTKSESTKVDSRG